MPGFLRQSLQSLMLKMRYSGQDLSIGTGFVTQSAGGPLLITNRHNVTGRHQETNIPLSKTGGLPDEIVLMHNKKALPNGALQGWVERTEPLFDKSGNPLWREHPSLKRHADIVALPLTQVDDVDLYLLNIDDRHSKILIFPGEVVSVIGFPFGKSAGGYLPVWATGFIASEPHVDYDRLPLLLVDCRTRQGQSGSPVIAFRVGHGDNAVTAGKNSEDRFVGIYSGRIHPESDIGMVWKASAIRELVKSFEPALKYPGPRSYIPAAAVGSIVALTPLPGEWDGKKFSAAFPTFPTQLGDKPKT